MKNIEHYNINYGYTTFLALLLNLRFNNSRKMEISALKEYPKDFIEKLNTEDDSYYVTMLNEADDFDKFLELNKDLFTIDEKYLKLDSSISLDDLYRVLDTYDYPFTSSAIYLIRFDYELKKQLKLNKISNMLHKYLKFETYIAELYMYYMNNLDNEEIHNTIRDLLEKRNVFYQKVLASPKEYVEDCFASASTFDKRNPLQYYWPMAQQPEYYNDKFKDSFNLVEEVLEDIYMFTLFIDVSNPTKYRVHEDLKCLDFKYVFETDVFDEEQYRSDINQKLMRYGVENGKINYTPRSRTNKLFYLQYIRCLDELQSKYGDNEELNIAKYKLLYLLDNPSLDLLDENNRDEEYEKLYSRYQYELQFEDQPVLKYFSEDDEIFKDPFDFGWYQVLIKACIIDIFESDLYDEALTYKKLAMIKTYYALTKDPAIIKLINQYSYHPNFWEYSSYIKNINQITLKKK